MKSESYFFNEIQRIKNTLSKIKDGRKWLVLIDELFKGTNIQDAMLCSKTVIDGLVCVPKSIFILSTHLYEIGEDLKKHPNIIFRYFETISSGNTFSFSYQLKDGISDDRFGYLILEKESVTELISEIKSTFNKNAP
jgi:DNA mismatch repair ATPase MutS